MFFFCIFCLQYIQYSATRKRTRNITMCMLPRLMPIYKYERNRHEKICNGIKPERKYKCNYCNECLPFVNIESLLQHIYYKHNISRTNFQQHLLLKYLLLQRFVQEINTVPISDGPGKKKRKNRKNRKKRVKKKQKLWYEWCKSVFIFF